MSSQTVYYLSAVNVNDGKTSELNFVTEKEVYFTNERKDVILKELGIKDADFYCNRQILGPKVNLKRLKGNELFYLDKGDISDNDLPVKLDVNEVNVPLDFVVIKNGKEFDRLFMEEATNKTTVRQVFNWISLQIVSDWDTCTFLFDEYGRTKELLRNENYPQTSKLMKTPIFDFLCSGNTIPVRIRNYGLNMKHKINGCTVLVKFYDRVLKTTAKVSRKEVDSVTGLSTYRVKSELITIYVKTLVGQCYSLDIWSSILVSDIKKILWDSLDVPPVDQQRLIWNNEQLKDDLALRYYNIKSFSILYLVFRLRGGGNAYPDVSFVDVTKGAIKRVPWSTNSVPKWRHVGNGLVLNGICLNLKCEAYGQSVYCTIGLINFDLILEQDKCRCPQCGVKFVPKCPGFNNCYWKVKSVKKGSTEMFISNWSKACDEYTTYDEQASGEATFSRMQFFIRPQGNERSKIPLPKACALCFSEVPIKNNGFQPLECQHSYHKKCLQIRKNPTECILCS